MDTKADILKMTGYKSFISPLCVNPHFRRILDRLPRRLHVTTIVQRNPYSSNDIEISYSTSSDEDDIVLEKNINPIYIKKPTPKSTEDEWVIV